MVNDGAAKQKALEIQESLKARGVDLSVYGKQPKNSLVGIHEEIEGMASIGIPIDFIHTTIGLVGIRCGVNTLRRYIQGRLPDIYERFYSNRSGKTSIKRGLSRQPVDGEEAVGKDLESQPEGKPQTRVKAKEYNSVQERYMKGSHLDDDRRERAAPASFFGENLASKFDFLKTTKRNED